MTCLDFGFRAHPRWRFPQALLIIAFAVFLPTSHLIQAATIWNGATTTFTLAGGLDPNQATNQDRLTTNVWITRASSMGIYNARTEINYTHFFSPQDTEWSYGSLNEYDSLVYFDWETWNGHTPPFMVGRDAVLHLISDDIYLAIKFTVWGGAVGGGGFAYQRSTPGNGVTLPAAPWLVGSKPAGNGLFRLSFTNAPGLTFTALSATNAGLALSNWISLGSVTDAPPGSGIYQFTDPGTLTNPARKFYRVRWP